MSTASPPDSDDTQFIAQGRTAKLKFRYRVLFNIRERARLAIIAYRRYWWKLIPGYTVKVRWPLNEVGSSAPADPDYHYRPWLEENVGRQYRDWDWNLVGDDMTKNRLTIKVRIGKAKYATLLGIMWA